LKHAKSNRNRKGKRRAPRGARGLKRILLRRNALRLVSRPARGAWIETWLLRSHWGKP